MTNKNQAVGILGAGISGLSVAYALARKNIPAAVYEKSDEVGGAIRSVRKGDWLVEEGPNTLMVKSQSLWDLLDELELGEEVVEANNAAKKRFIVKDGELLPLPTSPLNFLKSPLLSASGKLRLLREPFAEASVHHDESVAEFIRRRLGSEPLDYGVNPFISGIYAGDPESLSVKHTFSSLWNMEQKHGSLLKGMIKKGRGGSSDRRALISFEEGNQTLPSAMARVLGDDLHLSTEVVSVRKDHDKWIVQTQNGDTTSEHRHDCLVCTLPAHALPAIFTEDSFQKLAGITYVPLSVLALGYHHRQISHPLDGFGMLVPEVEKLNLLGSLFSSTLFPGRAPENHHLLSCFIGGARKPELAPLPEEELEEMVSSELDNLLGIEGDPAFRYHRKWQKAIPQYEVGYDYYISLMKDIEKKHRGLYLEGNFRGGVSVPDCIATGFETAQKAQMFLKSLSG